MKYLLKQKKMEKKIKFYFLKKNFLLRTQIFIL